MTKRTGAEYIQQERRAYSLYVLQSRAIPHAADGLKAASRRVMWMAKDGKEYKSSALAGATIPIHPHDIPEGAINTLAATYGNNVPLLKGEGAFGTLLKPTAYGASRYTSVTASTFARDVLYQDVEIIPMQENYDSTLFEPKHFLPLVPLALLNPQQGIAVGFACSILPRSLKDIIDSQILTLKGKTVSEKLPSFSPTNNHCNETYTDKSGALRYVFKGDFEKVNATTIKITNIPYGLVHEKLCEKLDGLEEQGTIHEYTDNSKNVYNIDVKFKKGTLTNKDHDQILSMLGLVVTVTENLTVIDFTGERVLTNTTYVDLIKQFTAWRLQWYYDRYVRLHKLLSDDIQQHEDVLLAIRKNIGGVAKKVESKQELREVLEEIGVHNINYIAELPVYRFTEQEKQKVQEKLNQAYKQLEHYNTLLSSEDERRKIYVAELQQVLRKHNKGEYKVV